MSIVVLVTDFAKKKQKMGSTKQLDKQGQQS